MKKEYQKYFFLYTIAIFALGMINITFALMGLACYIGPIILFLKHKDKTWCQYYCPRALFLTKVLSKISFHLKAPQGFTSNNLKEFFVTYMSLNLFLASMSTLMVYLGRIQPMPYVRLFMVFKAPYPLPQLFAWNLPDYLIHASYRVYSMMFSSVLIGLALGILFAPRTWCVICPVNTLSVPKHLKREKG